MAKKKKNMEKHCQKAETTTKKVWMKNEEEELFKSSFNKY